MMMRDFYDPGGVAAPNSGMLQRTSCVPLYEQHHALKEYNQYNQLLHENLHQRVYNAQAPVQQYERAGEQYAAITRVPSVHYRSALYHAHIAAEHAPQNYPIAMKNEELLGNESVPQAIARIRAAFTKGTRERTSPYDCRTHDYSLSSASRRSSITQERARLRENISQKKQSASTSNALATSFPARTLAALSNEPQDAYGNNER
ncbi:hypothetical protein HY772_08740 [Candidatus Woesearchaeota archaeon]|nr:hypothetical protein [Candidatus Woesearchaeota archaeon]